MFNHNSGVVLNAFASLRAISALTPIWPLINWDMVLRATPRLAANPVIVISNGSRYISLSISPGCMGGIFCCNIIRDLLFSDNQCNLTNEHSHSQYDPVIASDCYRPVSF